MSAGCAWPIPMTLEEVRRRISHLGFERGMSAVKRRRAAGIPPVERLTDEFTEMSRKGDWEGYFRALRVGREGKVTRADLELPPPEHRSIDPWPEGIEMPAGALGIKAVAESAGWVTHPQYARGWVWGVGTRMNRMHSIALRMHHRGSARSAIVIYQAKAGTREPSWTAQTVWIWGRDLHLYQGFGVTLVKEFLERSPGWSTGELTGWIAEQEGAAAAAKAKRADERAQKVAKGEKAPPVKSKRREGMS